MAALPASLRTLSLGQIHEPGDDLTVPPPAAVALAGRLPALGGLCTLLLDSCRLQGCGAPLAALPAGLVKLVVGNCTLDAGAVAALAGRMPALTALDKLRFCVDKACSASALMAALPCSLRALELNSCAAHAGAAGPTAAALAARVPALAALEELQLSGDFGAGTAPLLSALPPSLRGLCLSVCNLDPARGAALVARAPALVTLRRLSFEGSRISPEHAAALRAALPASCEVRYQ